MGAPPESPTMAPLQIKGGSTDYLTLAKNKVADASYVAWKLTRYALAARAFAPHRHEIAIRAPPI